MSATWVAVAINHGDYDELERCLGALANQSKPPAETLVFETGVCPPRYRELCRSWAGRGIRFSRGPNLGYAGGANFSLRTIEACRPDADYALVLNPDVELDPRFAEELIVAMERDPGVALASGKLLRPGRSTIDSAGIFLPRHRRPRDRGSEERDIGQYDRSEYVFALSGAALFLRRSSLCDLALDGEVFDEDFFAYHEDTDLAWRAARLGWSVLYEPRATAVHGRGWRREKRFEIPIAVRIHSFKNHYLQIIKNERWTDFLVNLPWLAAWELLRFGYLMVRDPALFRGYVSGVAHVRSALRKRRSIEDKRLALLRDRGGVRHRGGDSQNFSGGE